VKENMNTLQRRYKLQKSLEKVKENIVDAQERQKKAYDKKRHNPDVFKEML